MKKKRWLAILLSLSLLLTLVPTQALAEEGPEGTESACTQTADCPAHVHEPDCPLWQEDSTGPGETGPDETVPGETVPDEPDPDETVPGETGLGETVPDETGTNEPAEPGEPEETQPTALEQLLALAATLPDEVTAANAGEVTAQLQAFAQLYADLGEDEQEQDEVCDLLMRVYALQAALDALTGEGNGPAMLAATTTGVPYVDVEYDANGNVQFDDAGQVKYTPTTTADNVTVTVVDSSTTTWGSSRSTTWYVVNDPTGVTISSRITVRGNVHLILADGASLTASKGITVAEGNNLTIYGQENGTGTLATGTPDRNNAGIGSIGGPDDETSGVITINGGTVTATGGETAAGIGGGSSASGTVIINGGTVDATGGSSGAGIGGGESDSGTVTINGGTVKANGDNRGAGIGGGSGSIRIGIVTINGGTVNATGGSDWGAGIGSGEMGSGTVTITGGTVNATGGPSSAGIGGSRNGSGTVTITGGTVNATGGTPNNPINDWGAGIGGGSSGNGTVTITGGTVTATGNGTGAGIRGTLSTTVTEDNVSGNAFIVASSISDTSGQANWSGVIIIGNTGKVYGNPTLTTDATVPSAVTLTVPANSTLAIAEGTTLTNDGTINIKSGGALTNNGTLINNGTINIESGGTLTNNGTLINNGTINGAVNGNQPGVYVTYQAYNTEAGEFSEATAFATPVTDQTTWGTAGTETWYVVNSEAANDLTIGTRIAVSGDVHLILADGCTLTASKGIAVILNETSPNSLTIYGQSNGTGKLTTGTPDTYYAGIGGYGHDAINPGTYGSITIHGGTVNGAVGK